MKDLFSLDRRDSSRETQGGTQFSVHSYVTQGGSGKSRGTNNSTQHTGSTYKGDGWVPKASFIRTPERRQPERQVIRHGAEQLTATRVSQRNQWFKNYIVQQGFTGT